MNTFMHACSDIADEGQNIIILSRLSEAPPHLQAQPSLSLINLQRKNDCHIDHTLPEHPRQEVQPRILSQHAHAAH